MENYITDSLYFKDKKLYYADELVDYTNYLEALEDYGFESITDEWAMRLDDNYFLLDCGGDGDCLFHVISEALNLYKISCSNTGKKAKKALLYNAKDIRKIAADSVTRKNFRDIICAYTLAKESDEFIGLWNPSFVDTVKDLREEILEMGNNFWGDQIILSLIQEKLKLNVIILSNTTTSVYPTGTDINKFEKTIVIYYYNDVHFQLVSYFDMENSSLKTIFTRDDLPEELQKVYREDTNQLFT